MAGEDQERLEDFLAVERYIEDVQAGRLAHVPAELTPELARSYRMALSFHAASTGAAAPRSEFIAELQAKLQHVEAIHRAPLKQHRPCSSKERQEHPRLSRRALLRTGAVVAVSFSVGAGIDHALEEQLSPLPFPTLPPGCSWYLLVSLRPGTLWRRSTSWVSSQRLFTAGGIVGYVVRNEGESGDPTDGPVIAMSAACTHMGCLVNWENADRTFRCPCHGGVFSALGKTGATPATVRSLAPLPRVETIIDPEGNIFVRVPSQTSSIHF